MQIRNTICKTEEATPIIEKFFCGNKSLIALYLSVQEEMWKCDPDLLFCYKNGLIGLARKEEKYRFFIAPSEDAYDIKFAHMEGKIPFCVTEENLYLKECEKCILYILQHPESVSTSVIDDSEIEDSCADALLNRNQKKFCKRPSGKNIRLLAPAGSGKTFSLLWRCKYIAEDHKFRGKVPPYFLIVTFTRAACLELENRLKNTPEFRNIRATVRTLNSWGWEQIKTPNKLLVTDRF